MALYLDAAVSRPLVEMGAQLIDVAKAIPALAAHLAANDELRVRFLRESQQSREGSFGTNSNELV